MHRLWLLAVLPFAFACTPEASGAAPDGPPHAGPAPVPNAAAAEGAEDDVDVAVEAEAPVLTVEPNLAVQAGAVRLRAKLTGSRLPATFDLRAEDGCAGNRRLSTSTIGIGMTVSLPAEDLAASLACPVLARTGDVTLTSLRLVAEATVDAPGYDVDHDLEPTDSKLRLTVRSASPKSHARIRLGGTTAAGVAEDDGEGSAYVFEIPAAVWAEAVVTGAHAHVEVDGRTLAITPGVRLDAGEPTEDEGC